MLGALVFPEHRAPPLGVREKQGDVAQLHVADLLRQPDIVKRVGEGAGILSTQRLGKTEDAVVESHHVGIVHVVHLPAEIGDDIPALFRGSCLSAGAVGRVQLVQHLPCLFPVEVDMYPVVAKAPDDILRIFLAAGIVRHAIVGGIVHDAFQVVLPVLIVDAIFSAAIGIADGELVAEAVEELQFVF